MFHTTIKILKFEKVFIRASRNMYFYVDSNTAKVTAAKRKFSQNI